MNRDTHEYYIAKYIQLPGGVSCNPGDLFTATVVTEMRMSEAAISNQSGRFKENK